jgi:hypothetical protein
MLSLSAKTLTLLAAFEVAAGDASVGIASAKQYNISPR